MKTLTHHPRVTGTSFHGSIVTASVQELTDILGAPLYGSNTGEDKTNFEWYLETTEGAPITLYDYKYYRSLAPNEDVEWRIGSHRADAAQNAALELSLMLQHYRSHE